MTSSPDTPEFHYCTGETVKEGDRVISEIGHPAVIEMVIAPGTCDAKAFSCPNGGLLIKEDWDGTPSYLVVGPPDGIFWEDMKFISRKPLEESAE